MEGGEEEGKGRAARHVTRPPVTWAPSADGHVTRARNWALGARFSGAVCGAVRAGAMRGGQSTERARVLRFTNCLVLRKGKLLRWGPGRWRDGPGRWRDGPGRAGGGSSRAPKPCLVSACREDLWVRGGRILDPEKLFFEERRVADEQRDCGGCIVAPGFIDVQINGAPGAAGWGAGQVAGRPVTEPFSSRGAGGFGVDFSQATEDVGSGVDLVARRILAHGVTSFCPTLVTSPPEVYHKVMPPIILGAAAAPPINSSLVPAWLGF